jgi:hypothetical protein
VASRGHTLTLDKRYKFLDNADAIVGELTFDLILGGQIRVLVETESLAREVGA